MDEIYKMKLHQTIVKYTEAESGQESVKFNITRVPGGWIYTTFAYNQSIVQTFISFDNEFQTKD